MESDFCLRVLGVVILPWAILSGANIRPKNMDTSNAAAVGSPAHPNVQLWDMLYQKGKDKWTKEAVDQEVLKFRFTLTENKTCLDILVPQDGFGYFCPNVWKNQGHAVACRRRASRCWH